ncbi:hypothetical protein ANN_13431 [Periplaneta americana]|uniref:Uncharacterized protein n=1 Tax=Periplaneta americana TaxID=6978 RepID=A0ABQ8TLG9_PERAM|nr:hypothetical protein ANN_13431 [Periplaneta americana]
MLGIFVRDLEQNLKEGEFVIVGYDGQQYPAVVKKLPSGEEEGPTVDCMTKSIKGWKWPAKEDMLVYKWSDVKTRINPPKMCGKKGIFSIPELMEMYYKVFCSLNYIEVRSIAGYVDYGCIGICLNDVELLRQEDFCVQPEVPIEQRHPRLSSLRMRGLLQGDNAGEMSPGSITESYPAFARIGLRENPGKNLNQVTFPDRDSNPGHLVSRPDALTVTPQEWTTKCSRNRTLKSDFVRECH